MRKTAALAAAIVTVSFAVIAAPARAQQKIDHSAWTKLLQKYVNDKGQVDYKAWKAADVPALDAYLKQLEGVQNEDKLDKTERLALWINAYNAITIHAILDFYPIKSIKDKQSSFLGYKVWSDYKKTIAGKEVYLDQIENDMLRKWGEPRIHFAINCASKGCPILRTEAYEGAKVDAQLEDQVQKFLANPEKFKIEGKTVYTSMILKWFKADFNGGSDEGRLKWLADHMKDEAKKKILLAKDTSLDFQEYDWSLNEKPSA